MKVGVIADIHYGDKNSRDGFKYNKPSEGFEKLKSLLDRRKSKLDFLVLLGDQIDAVDEETDRRRLKEISEYFKGLQVESRFLIGNHELKNLDKEEVNQILDENNYGVIRRNGKQFIFLDTLHKGYEVKLGEQQMKWLKGKIQNFQGQSILFSHAPLNNFNPSNNRWLEGRREKARIKNHEELTMALENSNNKILSISGHAHQNSIKITQNTVYITMQSFAENISSQKDGDPCESYCELEVNGNIVLKIFEENSIHQIRW